MNAPLVIRRSAILIVTVAVVLVALASVLLAAIDAGYGGSVLIRYFASRINHPVQVHGKLQAHLFSTQPRVVAEGVVIANPPWMPVGVTAEARQVTLTLAWPGVDHPSGIVELEAEGAALHLARDTAGRSNWQVTDPDRPRPYKQSSIVRRLSVPDARVVLADAVRHLQFAGIVSAQGPAVAGADESLRIDGSGELNGRPVSFRIGADSLTTATHAQPYHFTFAEHSGGSDLEAKGWLPKPFDIELLDATLQASGPDLQDLYFLTGVKLLNTGSYHLSGQASRRGTHTYYRDLRVTTGLSDVRGSVSIDYSGRRSQLAIELNSKLLRTSDLGLRAAGRSTEPVSPLLLSEAALSPKVLRISDATIRFRAHTLDMGRLPLHEVSAKAMIDHGVLTIAPLTAEVLGGHANAHLVLDANKDLPAAKVDLKISDLQLGEIPHKDPSKPPVEGALQARVIVTGTGSSVHEVAASASGTVKAQLAHGAIRASMAELASGVDLRGLGMLFTHNKQDAPIRCAVAEFKADEGTLIAQQLIADTGPVLITAEGKINLQSEALDLMIHGRPKSLRFFRLRAPVLVQGTLAHPSASLQRSKSVPLIVDPGRAQDSDCPALLAGVNDPY